MIGSLKEYNIARLFPFLAKRIHNYYLTSNTPMRCIKYLQNKYPNNKLIYDHLAFRTINPKKFVIIKDELTNFGYKNMGDIEIPQKHKLDTPKNAIWLKKEDYYMPRIFLSIGYPSWYESCILQDFYYNKRQKYIKLSQMHDDYVFWTWLWDTEINHIALDMSDFGEEYNNIIEKMIEDLKLEMNNPEDIYQISSDGKLIQCSTKADIYNDNKKNFIEFVRRIDGRDGFEGKNATKIFDSTKDN